MFAYCRSVRFAYALALSRVLARVLVCVREQWSSLRLPGCARVVCVCVYVCVRACVCVSFCVQRGRVLSCWFM
jgi:hypothetical protein